MCVLAQFLQEIMCNIVAHYFFIPKSMIKFHFELPELGYQFGDLAPMMSQETISFHYGVHFRAYVDNLNRLVDGSKYEGLSLGELVRKVPEGSIADNAGQVLNHMLFFEQLAPARDAKRPTGEFLFLIEQSFGSFEQMIEQLDKAASSFFGSGWTFLAMNEMGELKILSLPNGDNPLRYNLIPLLAIDVWEHAYYLDYQNRRKDYLKNFWLLINWHVVSGRIV
jgi:Fe-Mn family superoxide dismutase